MLIDASLLTTILTAGTSCSQYTICAGMPWQDWNKEKFYCASWEFADYHSK